MSKEAIRLFNTAALVRFSEDKATVTVISTTKTNSLAIWGVKAGQEVPVHTHPDGQDTWLVVKGQLTYFRGNQMKSIISAGQIAVAEQDEVHGAINDFSEDAIFISIYSAPTLAVLPANA